MKTRKPYKLREYRDEDWMDPSKFVINDDGKAAKCRICGHHLPVDQVVSIEGELIHSDNTICLSLIVHKNIIIGQLKFDKEGKLIEDKTTKSSDKADQKTYDLEDDKSPCCEVSFVNINDITAHCGKCLKVYNVI